MAYDQIKAKKWAKQAKKERALPEKAGLDFKSKKKGKKAKK